MAVFLVGGILVAGGLFLTKTGLIEERGVLGGPAPSLVPSAQGAELDQAAVLDGDVQGTVLDQNADPSQENAVFPGQSGDSSIIASVQDLGQEIGPAFDRSGMISYTVQKGDTLSAIASYFGISVDTIASANPGIKGNALSVGQSLNILPTSGVVYNTQGGDTLESISSAFGVSQDKILQFNKSVNFSVLDPGTPVIIPGGKNTNVLATDGSSLPNFDSYFIMPANGYNWGILHHYNAVDIANSCGTPVVAAADGLVVPDENIPDVPGGWNGGYGNFVLIEHPFGNNVETRYAHLEQILVQVGDYVKQGQEIGLMGESGEATGCHVHFEVIGAHNPFAKS